MANDYLDLAFPDDANPGLKRQRQLDLLETGIDGYVAVDGSPEVIVAEGNAELGADNESLAILVARAIWREFGTHIAGLPPIGATHATALVTITAINNAGYTIPANTQIAIDGQTFTLSDDATITPGTTTLAGVAFTAFEEGEAGSGLAGAVTPITALAYVAGYTLDEPTSGGHEAEDFTVYENRLARRMRSFGRPELAIDFSERMTENPEVAAALVLDGHNADDNTEGNDATVTLVPRNTAGLPVSDDAKDERLAAIKAEKVTGWDVFIIDPTYTTVDVTAEITIWPGFDSATVLADTVAAITEFLNPATWGSSPGGEIPDWNQEPIVLRSELTTVINNVAGVRHLTDLTLAPARAVTAAASTDEVTLTAHGFSDTDEIAFTGLAGGAPLANNTTYFVRDSTTNTFKLAATSGGAAINLTTDMTDGLAHHPESLADQDVALAGVAKLPLPGVIGVTEAA